MLPKGFEFHSNWFYRLYVTNEDRENLLSNTNQAHGINLVKDLCVLKASELDQEADEVDELKVIDESIWTNKYDEFLFEFLSKYRQSSFIQPHIHVILLNLKKRKKS